MATSLSEEEDHSQDLIENNHEKERHHLVEKIERLAMGIIMTKSFDRP